MCLLENIDPIFQSVRVMLLEEIDPMSEISRKCMTDLGELFGPHVIQCVPNLRVSRCSDVQK